MRPLGPRRGHSEVPVKLARSLQRASRDEETALQISASAAMRALSQVQTIVPAAWAMLECSGADPSGPVRELKKALAHGRTTSG